MIAERTSAPGFTLQDQCAREISLADFRAAHTQVLGVSIDSIHCHANWGETRK